MVDAVHHFAPLLSSWQGFPLMSCGLVERLRLCGVPLCNTHSLGLIMCSNLKQKDTSGFEQSFNLFVFWLDILSQLINTTDKSLCTSVTSHVTSWFNFNVFLTYVMDYVTDDLALYGPTGPGEGGEVNQVQRGPETQNRSSSIKVYEQLPGPQGLIQVSRYWEGNVNHTVDNCSFRHLFLSQGTMDIHFSSGQPAYFTKLVHLKRDYTAHDCC